MVDYHASLYPTTPARFTCRAQNPDELAAWQAEFRPALQEALGLAQVSRDQASYIPLAEQLTTEAVDGYRREAWRLWVEPGLALPFYLLRPDGGVGTLPMVLTPHGHNHPRLYVGLYENEEEQRSIQQGDRDIAVQAVREGYLVIAPTTRGFGETRAPEDVRENKLSSCRTQLLHGLLVGRTPIGERVWDISRLIDWALGNLPVDPQRIAITGNSGGGTTAVFAGACETRLSVVVPGSYYCTFAGSIGSIFHCDCNYVPGLLRLGEMYDVAGLIAPRPFCAIAGVQDEIFPIDQVRLAYQRLLAIYSAAGAQDRCQLYEGAGGHRYYKDGAWPFMRQFL